MTSPKIAPTRLITNRLDLRTSLRRLRPHRIAVAYVGADWRDLIDSETLDEIIVSPTVGSNPSAIEDLAAYLTWDHVHFLDNLHAKIYLGKRNAFIGSPNLSHNAMGETGPGLHEVGVILHDEMHISELGHYIDDLIKASHQRYPTQASKKARLAALKKQHREAVKRGFYREKSENSGSDARRWGKISGSFDIIWVEPVKANWRNRQIEKYVENWADIKAQCTCLFLLHDDPMTLGQWVLTWKITRNNQANMHTKPVWFRIDYIVPNGTGDPDFPKLALYQEDLMGAEPEPANITTQFAAAFTEVINQDRYAPLRRVGDGKSWRVADARRYYRPFITEILRIARISAG